VVLTGTWPGDSLITILVSNGVKDLSGNAITPVSSTFTTANGSETDAPYVVTERPASGVTGVTPSSPVTLFINEPLVATSVPGALYVSENGVLVSGSTAMNANSTVVTFTPTAPFTAGAFVQVFLTSAALDLHGNALSNYTGQFTVSADPAVNPPTMVRASPYHTSENPRNTVVDIEFSEPLNPSTVTSASVYLRDPANQPVAGPLSMRNGVRTVRFTPSATLPASTYFCLYITTAVQDLAGNYLGNYFSATFTTVP